MHKLSQDNYLQKYIGFWRKDKQHGLGTEKTHDGTIYYGKFRKGKKSGYGKMLWNDGSA